MTDILDENDQIVEKKKVAFVTDLGEGASGELALEKRESISLGHSLLFNEIFKRVNENSDPNILKGL